MPELTKEIIVAMLDNGYIIKYDDTEKNIAEVKKAIQNINQELVNARYSNTPTNNNEN